MKTKDKPAAELREYLHQARRDRDEAERAVTVAEAAFDESGDSATSKALLKARDVFREAAEHVARAERLLAAAEEREAAEERKRLEALLEEINAKLEPEAIAAAGKPLADEEAALLVRLADCREKRRQLRNEFFSAEVKRDELSKALGYDFVPVQTWCHAPGGGFASCKTLADGAASPDPVRKRLQERIAQCRKGDPLIPFYYAVAPKHADYAPTRDFFTIDE